jgi:hypothetical protein
MLRSEVLDKACELISKDRAETYGDARDSFECIAALWTAYLLNHRGSEVGLNTADVAAMMTLMKVSRLRFAQEYADSWVDIAGYAALGCELATEGVKA